MLFNFTTWNHCHQGQIILEDMTHIMGHQLMALGHRVARNSEFTKFGYNMIIESFADNPKTIERIANAHQNGCEFIIIATEEPTVNGFNHGLEPAMIDRQNAFPAAAAHASGILHLMPGEHVNRWYAQFQKAAHAELGYAASFVNIDTTVVPDHDFGFYGKMTWRRGWVLDTLEAISGKKVLRITSLDVPRLERDAMMRRAKVILQIRANEEWGMVSSTRCATALSFGRPVVAEPHPYSAPWNGIIKFSLSLEQFYIDAIDMARNDWWTTHQGQMAMFKNRLTPEFCIGNPLRQIGVLS